MARISIDELYRGEGGGAKYGVGGIMGSVMQEIMIHGVPKDYDERTYIDRQAHAEGGGADENRGRLCVGDDRRGAALLLCGGMR